ncbi:MULTISPECIES: enediyne antibiotic chromoprotein [Streptomyces]|uniref:Enediyne antibiotic chromoprotein n=1 Tax=Streptomyces ardesiacus TaxID=285564 RepID=A0ABW8HDL3_9ACTN|nr:MULTISPECIES: enediyne antibiotic chromoprotein [Streptomyces]MCL7365480.1 enediyne antibiotic chromoprotein [Streptomyces ardesiacus]NEB64621.1 neocarzinostatin [Streptomyces diastaticus]
MLSSMKRRRTVHALAAAAAGAALVIGGSSAAVAAPSAAPAVSVSPATGLSDGDTVAVQITGFAPSTTVYAAECAVLADGVVACNVPDALVLTTDANGAASGDSFARATFQGTDLATGETHAVDCATVDGGCFFNTTADGAAGPTTPISFG